MQMVLREWQMYYGNQEAKILCQWDMFMMYWLYILYVALEDAFAFRLIGNWSSLPRDVGPCDLLETAVRILNGNGNFLSVVNCALAWKPGKQECSLASLFFRRKEDTWELLLPLPSIPAHALNILRVGQQHPTPHTQALSNWILKYC